MSSLPDERYETFVLTLINERTFLRHSEVTIALVNLELRRKDKECSTNGTSVEVMTEGGSSPNQRKKISRI